MYAAGVKPVVVNCAPTTTNAGNGVGNVNEATLPAQVAAVAVPRDSLASATVMIPVVVFTEVIGALVTLYAAGVKPVVVRGAPTTANEARGVGKVKEATPADQEAKVAVPRDCPARATVTTPVPLLTEVIVAFVTLYPAGAKPVAVRSALGNTPEGNGVGNV